MSQDTTIVVQFGTNIQDDGGAGTFTFLSAELDRRENGLNGGVTSFEPGDIAYFLIYKSDNVTLQTPVASAGTCALQDGTILVEQTQDAVFANTNTAQLSVPVEELVSYTWLGTSLGELTVSGNTATAANQGVGVARIVYNGKAKVGYIQSPSSIDGITDFSIVVVIIGNVT